MDTITLQSNGYTAQILPKRGGSCISLSRFGAQVLRTPKGDDDYAQNPYLWGTPLLFFPNRISSGGFEFEGRRYQLPINEPATGCFLHGTLHETPFEVLQLQEDTVTLVYRATDEKPYLTFPHAFTLTLRWQLSEKGLHQLTTFQNDSEQNMPVALAFHSTFPLGFTPDSRSEAVRLQLDTSIEYGRNMANYLPDGRWWQDYPDLDALEQGEFIPSQRQFSRFFRMGSTQEMVLTDWDSRLAVHYRTSDAYGYWMVVGGGDTGYVCVEPQSWLSNCPNAPFPREASGFAFIPPGQQKTYATTLSIESI